MAAGVSAMKKDFRGGEADAFGLVGIASAGAILAVLVTAVVFQLGEIPRDIPAPEVLDLSPVAALSQEAPRQIRDVALGLAPILTAFVVGALAKFIPLTAAKLRRIIWGLVFSYVGLVIFLTGVNAGFMDVGRAIGETLAAKQPPALLLAVASGPMTATFVLAFAQGAAAGTPGANVVVDGLGVIATVAMTPLIAIQILGLIYSSKTRKVSHA